MDHVHVFSTRKNRGFRPVLTIVPPYGPTREVYEGYGIDFSEPPSIVIA